MSESKISPRSSRRLVPWNLVARIVCAGSVIAGLSVISCNRHEPGVSRDASSTKQDPDLGDLISSEPLARPISVDGPRFTEVAPDQTGLSFVHHWKRTGRAATELTGPFAGGGVAIGDYDGDGRPDVYLTRPSGGGRMYRNLGDWRFEDVTKVVGIEDGDAWGTGASFVDIDNDGDLDLYVCNFDRPNRFYINQGDGTFRERGAVMGLGLRRASVMCSFADIDADGDLDAYLLTNSRPPSEPIGVRPIQENGKWTVPEKAREHKAVIVRDGKNLFYIDAGEADHLFRNNGDGTFTDVSDAAGIAGYDIGLSATWLDANDDGRPDLYVANDFFTPDHLYLNNGDGTFTDAIAETLPHTPWYSMGSDVADINNDGLLDLLATDMAATNHYKSKITMGDMQDGWFLEYPEPRQYMRNAVYLNTGTPRWMEVANLVGLANTDWTWAVKFADLDNDGFVDLFVANGMTRYWFNSDLRRSFRKGGDSRMTLDAWLKTPARSEPNLAYRNLGDLEFENASQSWGLDRESVSFGAALGDLDGDGDLDLIVNNFQEPVSLYRNNSASGHRLVLKLSGTSSNRFGLGATAKIETSAGIQVRYLAPYGGFCSSSEPSVYFGLGDDDVVDRLTVGWPSGHQQTFENVAADRIYEITEPDAEPPARLPSAAPPTLYRRSSVLSSVSHKETVFDDFKRQPLLPNQLSQLGPGMAWGDVDGDGDDDLYVSGAKGQPGQLLLRQGQDGFRHTAVEAFSKDAQCEDMAPLFFDADGDGDLDLYVVSGSIECEPGDELLRDRLYLNRGNGDFSVASDGALPDVRDSGSVVVAADYDRDGDLDLFVGGRSIPGKYPLTPASRLLRNDTVTEGNERSLKFADVTETAAAGLGATGLVTSALWSDADGDGWLDLIVTHDWGPLKVWRNRQGRLVDQTETAKLSHLQGWWNGIAGRDVDGDGDIDYAVTNCGLNSKYHASQDHPAYLYYGDFEGKGEFRLVEAKYEDEKLYPIRGRSCSTGAMPSLGDKFPTFHNFALATLPDIYTPRCLEEAHRFSVSELRSGVLINDGDAGFRFQPLPRLAQASVGFGVALTDVNADGDADVYLVQNFFGPQRETGRMDGGLSLLLIGNGDGTFRPVWPRESGLVVPGDAKSLAIADLNDDGWPDFVVGVNNDRMIAFENAGASGWNSEATRPNPKSATKSTANRPLTVHLIGRAGNPTGVGTNVRVHLSDESIQTAEVYAGSGYLSQSSPTLTFGVPAQNQVKRVEVRWPDGSTAKVTPTADSFRVDIKQAD